VRLEGLGKLKNPMTSLGIEPATFRLVVQCLNELRYRVLGNAVLHYSRIPLFPNTPIYSFTKHTTILYSISLRLLCFAIFLDIFVEGTQISVR
jgi:hypothetical protein